MDYFNGIAGQYTLKKTKKYQIEREKELQK